MAHRDPAQCPRWQRAHRLLAALARRWCRVLPPHDLLDCIVRRRRAACRDWPPPCHRAAPRRRSARRRTRCIGRRAGAPRRRAADRQQSTAFVRELRAGPCAAPRAAAPAAAVQLLTVHGAKGLEARTVVVVDCRSPAPRPANCAPRCWSTGRWKPPRRSASPSCAAKVVRCRFRWRTLLGPASWRRREREELNGAVRGDDTRARERLVFSRTEPHNAAGRPARSVVGACARTGRSPGNLAPGTRMPRMPNRRHRCFVPVLRRAGCRMPRGEALGSPRPTRDAARRAPRARRCTACWNGAGLPGPGARDLRPARRRARRRRRFWPVGRQPAARRAQAVAAAQILQQPGLRRRSFTGPADALGRQRGAGGRRQGEMPAHRPPGGCWHEPGAAHHLVGAGLQAQPRPARPPRCRCTANSCSRYVRRRGRRCSRATRVSRRASSPARATCCRLSL